MGHLREGPVLRLAHRQVIAVPDLGYMGLPRIELNAAHATSTSPSCAEATLPTPPPAARYCPSKDGLPRCGAPRVKCTSRSHAASQQQARMSAMPLQPEPPTLTVQSPEAERKMSACCGFLRHILARGVGVGIRGRASRFSGLLQQFRPLVLVQAALLPASHATRAGKIPHSPERAGIQVSGLSMLCPLTTEPHRHSMCAPQMSAGWWEPAGAGGSMTICQCAIMHAREGRGGSSAQPAQGREQARSKPTACCLASSAPIQSERGSPASCKACLQVPELDGVVPGAGEEAVAAHLVPVQAVHLRGGDVYRQGVSPPDEGAKKEKKEERETGRRSVCVERPQCGTCACCSCATARQRSSAEPPGCLHSLLARRKLRKLCCCARCPQARLPPGPPTSWPCSSKLRSGLAWGGAARSHTCQHGSKGADSHSGVLPARGHAHVLRCPIRCQWPLRAVQARRAACPQSVPPPTPPASPRRHSTCRSTHSSTHRSTCRSTHRRTCCGTPHRTCRGTQRRTHSSTHSSTPCSTHSCTRCTRRRTHLDAAVPAGRDQDILILLAPGAVVEPIGGVKHSHLHQPPRGHLRVGVGGGDGRRFRG